MPARWSPGPRCRRRGSDRGRSGASATRRMPSPPSTGCSPTSCGPPVTCRCARSGSARSPRPVRSSTAGGSPVSRLLAWHDPRGGRQAATLDPALAAVLPSRTGLAVSCGRHLLQAALVARRGRARPGRPAVARPARAGLPRARRRAVRRALDAGPHRAVGHPRRGALRARARRAGRRPRPRAASGGRRCRAGSGACRPPRRRRPAARCSPWQVTTTSSRRPRSGPVGCGSLCDSMGTAEALVAAVEAPPPPRVVAGLVSRGLSVYPHVVDSTTCLLGALRTGLVLGRALDALGATTIEQRLAFDAGMPAGTVAGRRHRRGARHGRRPRHRLAGRRAPTRTPRGRACSPAPGRSSRPRSPRCGPWACRSTRSVVTGGWAQPAARWPRAGTASPSARTHVTLEEPGATGAALLARWAATRHPEGSDPTTHEAPPAGWFTDPSA